MFYVVPDVPALTVSSSDSRDILALGVAECMVLLHAHDEHQGRLPIREALSSIVEHAMADSAHRLTALGARVMRDEVERGNLPHEAVDVVRRQALKRHSLPFVDAEGTATPIQTSLRQSPVVSAMAMSISIII